MQVIVYKIIPEPDKNTVTYSKNYRIFSAAEPLPGAVKIVGFGESVDLGSALPQHIIRKFRYSFDMGNWSLWYDLDPENLTNIEDLLFNEADVFFEVKYEYDDTTYDSLTIPLTINFIKFNIKSTHISESLYTPTVYCSSERCPAVIAEREASFKPYEVGTAIGIAKELSYQTNKIFGHEVVYFKTEPDRTAGDFIFKEWTLFETVDRKCAKVVVPNNTFPDNKPQFTEFGIDFEVPFEIHIDHIYFQSIFGPGTQPRKRDYMYFPLTNRMYEIQGSYLYRGFMMEPLYWKIQLTKFHPNIDMLMKADDRKFLDNIIISSDQLFGKQAEVQKKDALDKQQFKTISNRFDETRRSLHPDLTNRILDHTFNYSPLIEYYYDMSGVKQVIANYAVTSNGTPEDQYLTQAAPYIIYAYEGSNIFGKWEARQLNTGDTSIGTGGQTSIKMNGPKDSYNAALGKYVVVEGYKTLALNPAKRSDLTLTSTGVIQFKQSEHAVVYKAFASTVTTPNMTFSALVKFNKGTQDIRILDGYDNLSSLGLRVSCSLVDIDGIHVNSIFYVQINDTTYPFSVGELEYDKWYSLIVPVSSQYGQLQLNIYSFGQDPANIKNYNSLINVYSGSATPGNFTFVTEQNWALPSANYSIANIRLFNTMVQPEDHEFIVSQLFIRDESLLELIDNARPRLNVPFIAINS
jgi:hypothetical protein